jgi:hypothetical protein
VPHLDIHEIGIFYILWKNSKLIQSLLDGLLLLLLLLLMMLLEVAATRG